MGQIETDNYSWLNNVMNVARARFNTGDVNGLLKVLSRLASLHAEATNEQQLNSIESSTAKCISFVAQVFVDNHDFESAFELCGLAKEILDQKAMRFIAKGKKPRPDSMAWANLITVIGDAKWKGPDRYKDSVLSIPQMASRYFQAEYNARSGLKKYPRAESEEWNIFKRLEMCGSLVICAAKRHDRLLVDRLLVEYSDKYGDILADPGHLEYWQQKICDLFISREIDEEKYARCYEKQVQLQPELFSDESVRLHQFRLLQKEQAYLLEVCRTSIIEFNSRT